MKTYSLRQYSIVALIIPLLLAITISAGAALWYTYQTITAIHNANMLHHAHFLLLLTRHEAQEQENIDSTLTRDASEMKHLFENRITYKVWSGTKLITQSPNADKYSLSPAPQGFSSRTIDNQTWIVCVVHNPTDNVTVEITEEASVRTDLIRHIIQSIVLPLLICIPLLILIVIISINNTLKPLKQLSDQVNSRHVDDLHPLTTLHIPREILPLYHALNRLFSRLEQSILREREFTDNAAHELRTPLAAVKTYAQVIKRKITTNHKLIENFNGLLAAIDRSTVVVDQLLSFTRLQEQSYEFNTLNFTTCVQHIISDITPLAIEKHQHIQTNLAPDIMLLGHTGSLHIMLRNLLDNAIRYTPAQGIITVTLRRNSHKTITLSIQDTGSGIAPTAREHVFKRFTRMDTSKTGSGLGLAIVKWIADAHSASIHLSDNSPHGLTVTITFSSATT